VVELFILSILNGTLNHRDSFLESVPSGMLRGESQIFLTSSEAVLVSTTSRSFNRLRQNHTSLPPDSAATAEMRLNGKNGQVMLLGWKQGRLVT